MQVLSIHPLTHCHTDPPPHPHPPTPPPPPLLNQVPMLPVASAETESGGQDGIGMGSIALKGSAQDDNNGDEDVVDTTTTDKPGKLSQWTKNRYVAKLFPNLKSSPSLPDSSTNNE